MSLGVNDSFRNRIAGISFQQVQTFCVVYKHGGYAGAERHLGLSGPTMWEQIKVLERTYGVTLFQRAGRNIQPTEAGNALFRLMEPLLTRFESTFELMAEETSDAPQQVTLVTGVRMLMEELGAPFAEFRRQFPTTRLRLMTADNLTAQSRVLEGSADLALLIEPPPEILQQGVSIERLYGIQYLALLPPRHPLRKKEILSLSDLVSEPLIVGNKNTVGRQLLEQAIFRLGTVGEIRLAAETDNSAATIACVRAGIGIGVIAGQPDGQLTRHVAARSLAEDIGQARVVAAYKTGRQLTQALQTLIQLLKEQPS